MKVQCDVEAGVWRSARMYALEDGRPVGWIVTCALQHYLQDRCGPSPKPVTKSSKRAKDVLKVVGNSLGVSVASTPVPEPARPAPVWRTDLPPVEVYREKCEKCGDLFTIDKLLMHPKFPSKKFCQDCVDNMKNNQ